MSDTSAGLLVLLISVGFLFNINTYCNVQDSKIQSHIAYSTISIVQRCGQVYHEKATVFRNTRGQLVAITCE